MSNNKRIAQNAERIQTEHEGNPSSDKSPQANDKSKLPTNTEISALRSKRARRTDSPRHPLSLRLAPALEAQLNKEASKKGLPLRDYIREVLEHRSHEPVILEKLGLDEREITAITERIEQSVQAVLEDVVQQGLILKLKTIQARIETLTCKTISSDDLRSLERQLETNSSESTQREWQIARQVVSTMMSEVYQPLEKKSLWITFLAVLFLSLVMPLSMVCFSNASYPWELSENRTRAVLGHLLEEVWSNLPSEVQSGINQFANTHEYPQSKSAPKSGK